jgi:hypothetical protein
MEGSGFGIITNTFEEWQKTSIIVKKNLEPPYDSFGNGLQIVVCIYSNTSIEVDSTGFGILC